MQLTRTKCIFAIGMGVFFCMSTPTSPLAETTEVDLVTKITAQAEDIQYLREQLANLRTINDELRQKIQTMEANIEVLQKNAGAQASKTGTSDDESNTGVYRKEPVSTDKTRSSVASDAEATLDDIPVPIDEKKQAVTSKPSVDLSEEEVAYEEARSEFEAERYAAARTQFTDFLKTYPKSKLASNAGFWVGETYYREKNYDKAIESYRQNIEAYPEGNKVAASILKLGMSYQQTGELKKAKLMFETLINVYPKAPEAASAKQRLEAMPH